MELQAYNGWENKFTWLVHLHLSNEQRLMQEMVDLVARTADDRTGGLCVQWWVEDLLNAWVMGFPGRETSDEQVRLLVWDLVGAALAYADWDRVVKLLTGQATTCDNAFTWTLYTSITTMSFLQQAAYALLPVTSSPYAYADALHEWFKGEVDAWVDGPQAQRRLLPAVVALVHTLIHATSGVVCWEHIAHAFRAG